MTNVAIGRDCAIGWAILSLVFALGAPSPAKADAVTAPDYLSQVKPLLAARCYTCHGVLKASAGLRLDTVAFAKQGGDSGPAIAPGDAAGSLLLARVTHPSVDERMPPEGEGEPLTDEELGALRAWIAAGASGPVDELPEPDVKDHWSFRPRVRPPLPVVAEKSWVRNPIDAFVAAKRESLGISPQPEAPRNVLVRRVFLDLIGLPPTLDELTHWQSDDSAQWYETLVDRLLADPRHAERWARHWMDIWRYSDGSGFGSELRNSHTHIWHWRDWIVESLDADLPYDEMVRQMLAADELYPLDLEKLRATGYLARNYNRFSRTQWMEETIEHVGKGFLGLTFNCARCHDHKYDPIAQGEYFQLRAVFEPYMVRVDCIKDESDLALNGIPRVYDASLDIPTYRLIRGQESQPDVSATIPPGVPKMLDFAPFAVVPTSLPLEAYQPEQRTWILETYVKTAQDKAMAAEGAVAEAQAKLAAAPDDAEAPSKLDDAIWEAQIARSAWVSVHRRAAAMRARRAAEGAEEKNRAALLDRARTAALAASQAEREQAIVETKRDVAQKERKLIGAEPKDLESINKELADARTALAKLQQQLTEPSESFTPLAGAVRVETRHVSNQGPDPVQDYPLQSTGRRTALARWIAHPQNPLTARVAVNHLWNRHMGVPLTSSVFDFGRKGTTPTHPELLDWLASELVDSGWSLKHVHRLIVTSATYRMSSSMAQGERQAKLDPDNRTYWRRNPMRLEAQAVRDAILALADELDVTRGGAPVERDAQVSSKRRSLYFLHSNNDRNLFLTMFDDATTQECYRRDESIVPQQALALSNSKLVYDASQQIAARLSKSHADTARIDEEQFLRRAFASILTSTPAEAELAACRSALAAWRVLPEVAADPDPELRCRSNLVRTLLNDNDFVTLR